MSERVWTSLGPGQRIDNPPDRLDAAYQYAIKSQTHLWVATLAHKVGDAALDALTGNSQEPLILDSESLLMMPAVGCYVCEQVFEPRLRHRKCPGEPS